MRLRRARPLDEQPNRAVAQQVVRILGIFRRHGERRHRIDPLALRPQRLAAGGEDVQPAGRRAARPRPCAAAAPITCSQVSSTSSSRSAGERLRHALRRDVAAAKIEPDRRGNGDGHQAGIGDRRQLGQPDTVGKLRQQPARRGESEPRLADAAGAGQRDEPVRGGKAQDLAENVIPADQLGNRLRQVRRRQLSGHPVATGFAGSGARRLLPCRHQPPGSHLRCRSRP